MKAFILLIIISLMFPVFGEKIKIGFFQGYPSNFRDGDSGRVTGHTVEYLRDFISEIGYETEFIGPYPFPRLLSMLKEGEIDALLGLSYVKEREEFIYYPDKPYRISFPNIFVLKGGDLDRSFDPDIFADYIYSYRNGAALPEYLETLDGALEIKYLSRDSWITQSLQMLELGRIDGIINMSNLSIIAEAKKLGLYNHISMIPIPGEVDPLYLGISKASRIGKELLERYNSNLKVTNLTITHYDEIEY